MRLFRRCSESLHLRTFHRYEVSKKESPVAAQLLIIQARHLHVDYQKLSSDRLEEASETIRDRVEAARQKQRERFTINKASNIVCNADMRVGEVRLFCKLDEAGENLIRAAMGQMNLSARGYHRVLKRMRTIADLAGSGNIQAEVAEAL